MLPFDFTKCFITPVNNFPSLKDRIPKSFTSSNFDGSDRDYLPHPCLGALIDHPAILRELDKFSTDLDQIVQEHREGLRQHYNSEYRRDLATWILSYSCRTFAIMIHCNVPPCQLLMSIDICRSLNYTDEHLPLLDRENPPDGWNESIWSKSMLRDFYDKQWRFLVPVFSPENYHYDLEHNCIFPFNKTDAVPKVGAFSYVHKVEVYESHQLHDHMSHVAIKEILVTRGNDKLRTDEAWNQEARALANINLIQHEHIVRCIAAIRRGDSRYFMFPWADGDSLREYWNQTPSRAPTAEIILEAVTQLRELSDALDRLHNYTGTRRDSHGGDTAEDDPYLEKEDPRRPSVQIRNEHDELSHPVAPSIRGNIRHGDLKPENILRFTNSKPGLGKLKIADMGLAKQHIVATQDRTHLTSTRYGTIHYEPPEASTELNGPRSRLYDMWSLGCIALEFIIWILHGNDELNSFYNQVKGDTKQVCQYYEVKEAEGRAVVHRVVKHWIDHIQKTEPECSRDSPSAIKDLLNIIKDRLLVVNLPPTSPTMIHGGQMNGGPTFKLPEDGETVPRYRATAAELRHSLDGIIEKSANVDYLLSPGARRSVKPPSSNSNTPTSLTVGAARGRTGNAFQKSANNNLLGQPALTAGRPADYDLPPLKDWEFAVDNEFAENVYQQHSAKISTLTGDDRATLCGRCQGVNFWAGGFSMTDTLEGLRSRSSSCDFCRLLCKVCETNPYIIDGRVQLERKQSNLLISGDPFPILSICRSPQSKLPFPIQLGLPKLPEPKSDVFFGVVALWLKSCDNDEGHKDCRPSSQIKPPTRLIEVGTEASPTLRLIETAEAGLGVVKHIALSHPWGNTNAYTPFCTLKEDNSGAGHDITHFKQAIPEKELPDTFKDAILCTRSTGDFNEEAKKMEDVFSGAYCVLAASRAQSQLDGFLRKVRPQREYVTFQRAAEKPFYVCETIDNFNKDVIEGSLNKRGWVLQERALARRTIYFAEHQTYFECGQGVRCETLTKMQNNMADFLGDPNFPAKAVRTRGLKISYFQGLYRQYSRLNLSMSDDRPFAIAGLEKRLLKAYETKGGYGIFDDGSKEDGGLFHRSLLWQRGEEDGDVPELKLIEFPHKRNIHVPSWSWMAYKGGIDYADPEFGKADWETNDIVPPWTRGNIRSTDSAPQDGVVAITATVREYVEADRRPNQAKLVFDGRRRSGSDGQRAHCVVVARSNEIGLDDRQRLFHVLLVEPTHEQSGRGEKLYRRIGAGCMLGKYIALDRPGTLARIV